MQEYECSVQQWECLNTLRHTETHMQRVKILKGKHMGVLRACIGVYYVRLWEPCVRVRECSGVPMYVVGVV